VDLVAAQSDHKAVWLGESTVSPAMAMAMVGLHLSSAWSYRRFGGRRAVERRYWSVFANSLEQSVPPSDPDARLRRRQVRGIRGQLARGGCGPVPRAFLPSRVRTGVRARGAGRPRARRATTRSSAKSGDSGPAGSSEGDGAGEPPPPRRPEVPLALVPRRALRDWWRRRSRELERTSQVRAVVA
jgi:hypothetical protein